MCSGGHQVLGFGDASSQPTALFQAIEEHQRFLQDTSELAHKHKTRRREELLSRVEYEARRRLTARAQTDSALAQLLDAVARAKPTPTPPPCKSWVAKSLERLEEIPYLFSAHPSPFLYRWTSVGCSAAGRMKGRIKYPVACWMVRLTSTA